MKSILPFGLLIALGACIQIQDRTPDSLHAKIDTSNGLLATSTTHVDSSPASSVPRTPPLIGADSATVVHGGPIPVEVQQALRSDTASTLTAIDSSPAAAPSPTDLDVLRREMQVPVRGMTPAMLHDTYGELRDGTRQHQALDILAPRGTPVLSAASGRVLKLFTSKAGGLMVYAADSSEHFILMYAHLDAYQPGLAAGQPLKRGQQIGIVGTTGNAPANVPHLHFAIARSPNVAVWWKGSPVNPYPLLTP